MKPTRTIKLTTGFALALGLLGAAAWFAGYRFLRMEETAASVAHTYEVQSRLTGILSLMQDVELGTRGFVLTGQPEFLEPFEAAVSRRNADFQSLCAFTSENPHLRVNCGQLAPLIAKRIAVAQAVVDLRRNVGLEAALAAVASGEGKAVMAQIRAVLAHMGKEEQRRLEERSVAAKREATATTLVLAGGTSLAFVLLIGTFALVLRESQLRQQSQVQVDRFFTLSLHMLAIADMNGYFKRLSPAFSQTLGYTTDELLARPCLDFVHPDDRAMTLAEVEKLSRGVPTVSFENRYQCQDGSWRWLSWKTQPVPEEGLLYATARDITRRKQAEASVSQLNADLQVGAVHVQEVNRELEAFSYSVSHDLRAPLRSIDGFSQVLLEDYADHLDEEGKDALQRVRRAAMTMGELIDALLALSRVSRAELRAERVDLSALAATIADELRQLQPDRQAEFVITPGLVVEGDRALLRAALENLLGNALKYTQPRTAARIEFSCFNRENETVYFVRDNGVGFDMTYVGKLFGAFQRLHRHSEFSGTGIGLATVQRIIHRHGGRAWGEGEVDQGATFYFTLHGQARSNMAGWENAEAPASVS